MCTIHQKKIEFLQNLTREHVKNYTGSHNSVKYEVETAPNYLKLNKGEGSGFNAVFVCLFSCFEIFSAKIIPSELVRK